MQNELKVTKNFREIRLQVARLYIAVRRPSDGYIYTSGRPERDLALEMLMPIIKELTRVIAVQCDDDEYIESVYYDVKDAVSFVKDIMLMDKTIAERVEAILNLIDVFTEKGEMKNGK